MAKTRFSKSSFEAAELRKHQAFSVNPPVAIRFSCFVVSVSFTKRQRKKTPDIFPSGGCSMRLAGVPPLKTP